MTVMRASAEAFTMCRYSRCSKLSGVSSVRFVIPMMPFIGVRISWLMFARKSPFARFAASAASIACSRSRVPFADFPLEFVLALLECQHARPVRPQHVAGENRGREEIVPGDVPDRGACDGWEGDPRRDGGDQQDEQGTDDGTDLEEWHNHPSGLSVKPVIQGASGLSPAPMGRSLSQSFVSNEHAIVSVRVLAVPEGIGTI